MQTKVFVVKTRPTSSLKTGTYLNIWSTTRTHIHTDTDGKINSFAWQTCDKVMTGPRRTLGQLGLFLTTSDDDISLFAFYNCFNTMSLVRTFNLRHFFWIVTVKLLLYTSQNSALPDVLHINIHLISSKDVSPEPRLFFFFSFTF